MDSTPNVTEDRLLDNTRARDISKQIATKIGGKPFCKTMEKDGSLDRLLSSLEARLDEEGNELKIVQKEAAKLMYGFMSEQGRKVVAHPQHIMDIPLDFIDKNKHSYPSEEQCEVIAEDTGLVGHQVLTLFENSRKRSESLRQKHYELGAKVISYFSLEAKEILSKWKSENPGKRPDEKTRTDLGEKTGLSETQVYDWFGNEGRKDRKKKISKK